MDSAPMKQETLSGAAVVTSRSLLQLRQHAELTSLLELRQRAALNFEEFARLFGRKKNWAYRLAWRGELRVIKPGGEMMIPQSEVDRLISKPVKYEALP
jgi:hypothetical protein